MDQREQNQQEWANRRTWRWWTFYYGRNDTRLIVPKRWGWGWTLNFARPGALLVLAVIMLCCMAVAAAVALGLVLALA
jgi:uncharacterized membrane protein